MLTVRPARSRRRRRTSGVVDTNLLDLLVTWHRSVRVKGDSSRAEYNNSVFVAHICVQYFSPIVKLPE